MKKILADIQSGKFADEWITEYRCGLPHFRELRQGSREASRSRRSATKLRGADAVARVEPARRPVAELSDRRIERCDRAAKAGRSIGAPAVGGARRRRRRRDARRAIRVAIVPARCSRVGFCLCFFRDPERAVPADDARSSCRRPTAACVAVVAGAARSSFLHAPATGSASSCRRSTCT